MGSIAFTGNRDYADRAALFKGLDRVHADRYYFGGARGADTDALEYVARTQPASQRVVVVPNCLADQPIATQPVIRQNATDIIELRNTGPDRYQIRNRYMVDHADRVVAFTDGRKTGGTYNTVRYSLSQGKNVEFIQWFRFDVNEIYAKNEAELVKWILECKRENISQLSIKGMVVGAMKRFPRSSWTDILSALHGLR